LVAFLADNRALGAKMAGTGTIVAVSGEAIDPTVCGVIMPISATANQAEAHWADVQTLLHRAIKDAGFIPVNVWENSAADRVSERIIANIFEQTLIVADISDLNPNVMLELGLRLASKKPTIVIVNSGGVIPFDIRDFHVISYPTDLNMLGMEKFFRTLSTVLKEKAAAYGSDEYQPFLGKVVVDVISPGHREVSFDVAIFGKLDEIGTRLSKIESRRAPYARPVRDEVDDGSMTITSGQTCYFTLKGDHRKALEEFMQHPGVVDARVLGADGSEQYIAVKIVDKKSDDDHDQLKLDLRTLGRRLGCVAGVRGTLLKNNSW
jgi:hypothetical protein